MRSASLFGTSDIPSAETFATYFATRPSVSETVPPLRHTHLHALRDGTRRIGQHETDLLREIDLPDLPLLGT